MQEGASSSSISATSNSNDSGFGQDESSEDFDFEPKAAAGTDFFKRRQSRRLKDDGATDYNETRRNAVGVAGMSKSFGTCNLGSHKVLIAANVVKLNFALEFFYTWIEV